MQTHRVILVAYKLGEIAIGKLRKTAEAAPGSSFDKRAFYDVLLLSGALPLSIGFWHG